MPIELDDVDSTAVIRWNDGDNRFNLTSLRAWAEVLDELEQRDGDLAVVITGSGKFFSNGLDLDWMRDNPDRSGEVVSGVHRLLGRMLLFPAHVVGALNGHTFAAGAMLASTFDDSIMRDDRGYWCLPEVDLGLPLTPAMHATVTARLPTRAAQRAIILGHRFTAAEAAQAGIVTDTAAESDVVDRAVELSRPMNAASREIVRTHKLLMFGSAAELCGVTLPID
jgi:enoyl-CoA hydratase/carnithine racemase